MSNGESKEHESFGDKFKSPFKELKEKLRGTHLHDAKIKAVHMKHSIGKLENLVNRNHRHDEEHEKENDEKRLKIRESHRYKSFAPIRQGNKIKWYVDGQDYFWAVSVALDAGKEVIYIEDWWLSPEVFMRRPPYYNQEWRLDQILKRKAEQGVKIFVIVYQEVEQALTVNSEHTKHALQGLCPEGSPGYGNIKIMRHPAHFHTDMTFYWAHHEKFIVIDFKLAFIGGLDLCWGRWDQRQHPLADVHPSGVTQEMWPGQDFNNNRVMDFHTVDDWKSNELSKAEAGRMPWHDVAMGVIGDCVYDIAEHFVLRWNFVKRDKYKRHDAYPWIVLAGREGDDEFLVGVQRPKHPMGGYEKHGFGQGARQPFLRKGQEPSQDPADGIVEDSEGFNTPFPGTVTAQIVRSSADWSSGLDPLEDSIQTAYKNIIENAEHYVYIENQFFITATGEDQAPIFNTIGRAIVNAVLRAAKEGRKFRVIILIPAIPGFAGDLRSDAATGTRAIMDYQYKSINRGENSIFGQIKKEGIDPEQYVFIFNLRKYDRLNKTPAVKRQEEKSGVKYQDVQRAEAEEIMGSGIHGAHDPEVSSSSDEELDGTDQAQKEKTIDQKRKFEAAREEAEHHPSEKGHKADTVADSTMLNGTPLKDQAWDGEPEEEQENWVQEELYIHGKVMIADDKISICGSSNINDRSQKGDHDSELAIVMEDTRTIESTMDGKPYQAGYHAATLRRFLWREHLGLLESQPTDPSKDPNVQPPNIAMNDVHENEQYEFVADPLSDQVWNMWVENATSNTDIFRRLFRADPDNEIKTFEDYEHWVPKDDDTSKYRQGHLFDRFIPNEEVRNNLSKVKGHLVWFPLDFLCDATMADQGLQVNTITESIYT